jgi:hypothetical protein
MNPQPIRAGALLLIILLSFAAGTGCRRPDKERVPVARVDDQYLYLDEVTQAIPEGAKESDSIFAIRSFADNWIRQQVLLRHAEENLRDLQTNFERQLKEYRNALLIFTYEEELVKQKLDTVVTDQEINAYYEANKEDFILKENIVKVLYAKVYRNEPTLPQFRRLMNSDAGADRLRLADLCRQNAVNFYLDNEAWLFFNDLLKEIPIVTYNQEAFLNNNRFVEIQDSTYHYLIDIRDFRITDTYSPVTLETDRIRYTIINKRKAAILAAMSKELYERAGKKKRFETFY